jgi:hypothetical protein
MLDILRQPRQRGSDGGRLSGEATLSTTGTAPGRPWPLSSPSTSSSSSLAVPLTNRALRRLPSGGGDAVRRALRAAHEWFDGAAMAAASAVVTRVRTTAKEIAADAVRHKTSKAVGAAC